MITYGRRFTRSTNKRKRFFRFCSKKKNKIESVPGFLVRVARYYCTLLLLPTRIPKKKKPLSTHTRRFFFFFFFFFCNASCVSHTAHVRSVFLISDPQQLFQQQSQQPARYEPITEVCLGCICESISSCNSTLACEGDVCGMFRITWAYWADSGKPVLQGDNPNDGQGNASY